MIRNLIATAALAATALIGLAGTANASTGGPAPLTAISQYGHVAPPLCVPAASLAAFAGVAGLTGVAGGVAYWEGNNPTVANGPFGPINEIAWVVPNAACTAYTIHYQVLSNVNSLLSALSHGFPA